MPRAAKALKKVKKAPRPAHLQHMDAKARAEQQMANIDRSFGSVSGAASPAAAAAAAAAAGGEDYDDDDDAGDADFAAAGQQPQQV